MAICDNGGSAENGVRSLFDDGYCIWVWKVTVPVVISVGAP